MLLQTDGFRLQSDIDASCEGHQAWGEGGLGARDMGRYAVARVRRPPGGEVRAVTTVPARRGLCTCAQGLPSEWTQSCRPGEGPPVQGGTYRVGASMPVAMTREGELERYTFPCVREDIVPGE